MVTTGRQYAVRESSSQKEQNHRRKPLEERTAYQVLFHNNIVCD